MLVEALEQIRTSSPLRRRTYVRIILAALALIVLGKTFRFFEGGFWYGGQATDFSAFHIVAQRIWLGDLDQTYQFSTFLRMQSEASGGVTSFMPWTYPPQFDLLLAPFAFLPGWAAYFLFTTITLVFYLGTLRAIAENNYAQVLILLFPAIAITIGCGQNGFLTGALIGLICISADKRPLLAGLALGAMIIKPHLAIAAGIYLLLNRNWMAIVIAAAVVVASSVLCTIAFGSEIWMAWFGGIKEAATYLEQGRYPLYRMISTYSVLYKLGVPTAAAFWGQLIFSVLAIVAVALGVVRGLSSRFSLGIVATVSVMLSPYAYDYDLPIIGIGLALMLPELTVLASVRERSVMYGLIFLAGVYGLLQSARLSAQHVSGDDLPLYVTPAVAGVALLAFFVIMLRLLLRNANGVTALPLIGTSDSFRGR
jgi:hypothetical protein